MSPIAGWVNWCLSAAFLITWSCLPFEQPNKNTPIADMQSVCHSKQRVMFILGLIVAWCHVLADGCDKEWTLLEDHPWSMAITERIKVFSSCPPFSSFLPWLALTGFMWGTFLQNLKGSEGLLRERERFWWRSFSLRRRNATRPGVSIWNVTRWSVLFFHAYKACRRGSEPQFLPSFPPLPFGVHSYFPLLYLLLSSIWLCVSGSLTLAEHHLDPTVLA